MILRAAKGLLMGVLFGIFLLGILLELLVVLPAVFLLDRAFGANPARMQGTMRLLVGFWLLLLRACGLLAFRGAKGLPFAGPCVVVCNHPGLFDVLFLIRDIPRMAVMVKRSLATRLPLGPIFRAAGYVLSPDFEGRGPLQCLEEAAEKVARGYKFLIFPEATRSPKGGLGGFTPGPFGLARIANVPVQPVLIRNDPPFLPKGDKWYLPPRRTSSLEIEFWEPLAPPRAGEERQFAAGLEARYRKALGLAPEGGFDQAAGHEYGIQETYAG